MSLRYKWGEFGESNPIKCVDSKNQDADISFADVTKSVIHILSDDKTKVLDTITDANFTITSPNVFWTPTQTQAEKHPPGNYRGEIHLKNTAETRLAIYEFAIFVEKARGNIT